MRIAILIDLLVPGGVQKAAIEETRHLRAAGHQADLFCLIRSRYDYQYQDLLHGLSVSYLSDQNPWPFRHSFKIPFLSFLTTNHLLCPFFANRYSSLLAGTDLIIAHGTTTCFTAMAIKAKLGLPYLAFIWDPMGFILHTVYARSPLRLFTPILDRVIAFLERRIVRNAAKVITPSQVHQRFLKRAYGVKAAVIYPGHDFKPKRISLQRTFILAYSRWQKEKHPEYFLKLARAIKVPIVIAGLWTDRQTLSQMKQAVDRENLNITFIDSVTHKDIPTLARRALAWVHPHFEAFGMPGLELAALGVTPVILKGSGVAELFQNGVHGYFPETRTQMLTLLKTLADNPQQAVAMGKAAARVAKNYTWKFHTQTLLNAIVLSQKKSLVILNNGYYLSGENVRGGDRYAVEIASRLHGHRLTVITPAIGLPHWKTNLNQSLTYRVLPPSFFDNRPNLSLFFLAYVLRSLNTYRILKNLPEPAVIFSISDLLPDIVPAFLYKRTHPRVAWIVNAGHLVSPPHKRPGNFLINTGSFFLQRLGLNLMCSADLVLADNQTFAEELAQHGIPKRQIEVHFGGGVDVQPIRDYIPKSGKSYTAAFVGYLSPHKGVFDLVPIWKEVTKAFPKATLAIVGQGPADTVHKLQKTIRAAHLTKNIELVGFLSHKKGKRKPLFDLLKNTGLLLFTDHEAGFGIVVAEAMAAGVPVVSYNLPFFGTTYTNGFRTVPLGNTTAFATQVVKLLTNKDESQKLSSDALSQAEEFDWKRIIAKLKAALNQL